MNQIDLDQQMIQGLLQPEEKLLWWERPQLKNMRMPLQLGGIVISGSLILIFSAVMVGILNMIYQDSHFSFLSNLLMVAIFSLLLFGKEFLQTFTAAWRKSPPYRKSTLYAVTDRRALLIINVPAASQIVLEYRPEEIDIPTSVTRSDGAGSLIFASERKVDVGKYRSHITIPGSFLGISNVEHARGLLLQHYQGSQIIQQ
jgi:hypothetical protein